MNDKLNEARIKSAAIYLDSRKRLGTEPLPTVNQYDNSADSVLQNALTTTKTRQQKQAEQVAQLEAASVAENTTPQNTEQAQLGYSGFTPDNEDALNMKREFRSGGEYAGDFANAIASGGQRAYGSIVNTATITAYGLRNVEEAFGGRGIVELQEALDQADEMTRVTATQNWLQQRKSEVSKAAAQELEAIRNDTSLTNSEQFKKTSEFYARNPTMAGIGIVESALGSFLEMAATGGLGKAVGLSGKAAVNAGMFTSGANAYIQDVQADGTATDKTLAYGAGAGVGTALLGIGARKLIGGTDVDSLGVNGLKSGRAGVKNWARGTVQEATEETPQNTGQGVLKQLENNQPWDEGIGINAAEGLILGAGSGGMMSAPSAVQGVAAAGVNKANTKMAERDTKKYGTAEENLDPTSDKFNPSRAYNNALYELKSSDPNIRKAASELLARSTSTTYEELAKIDAEIAETTNETTKKDLMAKRTKFVDTQLQPLKAAVENHINASTQNKENFLLILKQYGEDKRKREEEALASTTDLSDIENEAQNSLNTQITERLKVVDTANYANELAAFKGTDNKGSTVQIAADASQFTDLINSKAKQYGVPATLINAIVQTESAFNPNAKSGAGAVGLMQLMPGTAKDLKVADRANPEQNIDGGVRYIAQLLKRYDGNINNALMAYNWGMGNVDAYLKTGKGAKGQAVPDEAKQYTGKVKAAVNSIMGTGLSQDTVTNSWGDAPVTAKALKSKLKIKQDESVANGTVLPTTASFAEIVQNNLGDNLQYFSAFNDTYHNNKGGKHPVGKAFDVVLKDPSKAAQATAQIQQWASDNGYEVKLLNEYDKPSANSTGGHIHVTVVGSDGRAITSTPTNAEDDTDTSSSTTTVPTDDVVANETTNTSESTAQTQQDAASEETQESDEAIDNGLIENTNTNPESEATSENAVELTPEEAAFEEVAMNQTRAFFSSMSNEEVDNHPLLKPAEKTALKELLAFESTLKDRKSVEEVRKEIEEGSKGATDRESNLGIQQYSEILRAAFASNDVKTASTYLDYLQRFANNSVSKSNAIAKANAEGASRQNPVYLASNSDSTWVAVSQEEFAQANKEGRSTFAAIGANRGTKAIDEEAEMLTEAFEVYKKGGEALLQRPIILGDNTASNQTPVSAPTSDVSKSTGNLSTTPIEPTEPQNLKGFEAVKRIGDDVELPENSVYIGRAKQDGKIFSMGNVKSEEDIGTKGWLGSEHNEKIPAKGMELYIDSFKTKSAKFDGFVDELISMKDKTLHTSPKASKLSEVGFIAELLPQLPSNKKDAVKFIQRIESYSPTKGITLSAEIKEEVPNAPVRTRHDIDEVKERSAVPASKKAKVKGKAKQGITTTNARNELSTNSYEETDSYTNKYSGVSSSGKEHSFAIKREKGTNFIKSITHTVNGKTKKNSIAVTDNTVSDELLMSRLEKSLKAENEFVQDNLNTKKDDASNTTEYEGKVLPKELVEKPVKVTEAMKIYADTLEQDSISETERALYSALINTLINFNPDMKVVIGKGKSENSYDAKTNTIKVNLPMTDGSVMQEVARMVISVTTSKVANELEQLGSTDLVVDLTKMYDLNADLTKFRDTIDRVIRANDGRYNHLDDNVKIKILEAMKSNSNLLEMATTDLDIMTFLQSIKATEQKVKQSLFTKIVNSLKSFLNVGNTGKVSNQFDKLLEITVRTASEQARNKHVSFATSEDAKIHLFSGLDNTSLDILQAQEMQKNFYERNQLLAGFKQKSSKAKPLTSISDFTAKLKLDLMQGLQTLVSEAPTKAQREQVEDFLKFRDEIATHVKDTFRKKEGGKNPDTDYGYQDLKTYFMDDSGAINENVVTSVALAAYDWSIENGNKTMNMHKDLKKLLNLEVDDTVFIPPHIQEEYAYRGQLRPFVRAKIGKKAIDSLGLKANDTMSLEAQSRLENSMGEWVISAMQAADLIHINTMKSTDHFENIETVGGDLTGVDNINEAGQVSFVSITTPAGRDINPRLNEITTKNKGTINYLSKVFGMEIGLRAPFKKPPSDVMTKIKRTTAKMSLNQRRYVKKMQGEPISINKDMTDTLQNLLNSDRDITLEMIGAHISEADLAKEHKNNRHSKQSAAEGVYRDLENGLDFVGSLNKINDNEYESFYDAVYAAKNNRMHYNSNMFNFQSSKLQRSMGEYTNFKNDIDMTGIDGNDITIYDTNGQISGAALFIRAVAESAEGTEKLMKAALEGSGIVDGFTVDKVDSELFVKPFFTYLTTDADVQTAVAAINKSLKGKQLSKDEVQSIAKVVKFWEGDANSLRALVEFTKFQNSLNNGDSTFTTSLGLGSDGINNGSAISYTLFGVGNDKFFTQVGLLLKDGRYGGLANYFQTRTDSTIGDYYTGFEEHINDAFGEQTDNQKMILELNTNFFKRKSFKAVLIPFGYSAGMPRLRALVFGQFLSDITSQFVALSQMDTSDENYTNAKNKMEVNLSNLIGETISLPDGKDILEFWFTPQQENALRKIYDKEIGAGVVKALEAYAAPFIAQRERNVKLQEAAYNTYALLKDVIVAKEVEKYIELLKHNPEYAELTDKQFDALYAAEGMPANYYKKHVQPKLDAIRPTVATPFNKDSTDWFDESDFDIPQESTTLKADKSSNSGTWKVNADGNLVGSNVSVAKAVRDEVSSGVMVNSAQVQGTDAMISARASAFGGNVNINVHDANISGLLNYVQMGLEQNKATFESLRDYHAQTHSLLAFSKSINSAKQLHKQGDITTEQLQDILIESAISIYGQETIDTYLSENGLDKEVSDKDIKEKFIEPFITGIMADTLATEYRKFEQLSNMGIVHQYGGEGAQYTVTAEDLKGIDNQKVELRKLFNDIQTNFEGLLAEPKKASSKTTDNSFVALFDTKEVYEKWSNTRDGTDLKAMQDQILDIANTYAPLITEDNKEEVMKELLKFKWFKSVDAETREKAINVLLSINNSDSNESEDTSQATTSFKSINDVANNFRNLIANPASSISEQRIKLFEYVMGRVKNHESNSNRVIKVAMVKDLNKNERGRFDVATNTIYINENYVNATDTDGRMEVFLHETLHALTAVTIATNKTEEVKRAVHNLEVIRASLQLKAKQQGNNYLANVVFESVDEMVAYGMTDYDVQMFMRDNLKAKLPKESKLNAHTGRANNGLIGFLKSVFSLFKQKNDTFEIFLRSADTVTTGYTDTQLSEYTGKAYHSSTSSPVETLKNLSALNVSTEHNEHLDTIIDTTIADFLGEGAANETIVTDVINKVSTRAVTAGFKMSDKELHVMEIVKVISQAYLKDNAGSVTAKEVRKAHERAMNEITVNTFLTDPSTATKAERKQAQRKYNYIFKQDKLNSVEQLERFFSLALTSEDFKNTLTTLDNVKKKVSEKGLFDKLVKAFVNMMTWLTAKTLNTSGLNMSRELDVLYKKLADVNKSAKNNEANLLDKTYTFTTSIVTVPANFAASKIIDALFKVFNFGSASKVLAVRNISSSLVGMRETGVGSIVNSYLGLNTSATSVDGSNRLNGFGELLYELGRNTGMKGVVEGIIRATNKAGQLRQSVVQATKSALAKEFTDFDKVEKAKLDSLTKVVLRTDMSALLDNGVNVNRVVKLLRDSKERRAEIAKHEAFIATYANHNDILLQTKALGYYMATEVAPEHLVKNAEGIAIGKDSWYEVDISLMDISLRNSIDQLASLYAVEATKKQDRDLLEQLITEQPDAIKAILKHHLEMAQRSKEDFKDNMPNYVKGYMPQKTHELRSLKFAETEKEVKKLEAQGWEIITEDGIAQDISDNSDTRVLMFHNDMLYQDYVSGALDMKDTHAKGTMVYSVATDLAEVNRVKNEKLKSRRKRNATAHTNYNFAKQKGGNLIASYNASGELTGYHYEMSGRLRDTYLERDNNAIELLGIYNSNLAFKPEVIKTQQTLAQELHKDFVNSYGNDPRQFVTLDPESKDPNVVAMWRMMPYAFRKEAETLFGKGKPIVVRNTIYNTVFGFRTYSMSEMFEKVNRERNTLENFVVSIMTAISGDKAQMRMLQGERLWQKGISQMKDFIVIRNYKVLIGNIVSNSLLLSLEGITPSQQIKDFISVWRNGGMYRKLAARVLEIDSEIALNKGKAQVISRLKRERNVALNEMQNNPMHEFMEAGLMSSIVEDTNVYKEDSGFKSELDKKIDKLVENVPEQVVTAFNWALMSPGTPMHNFMAHSTQFSDLAAKYSLIKHRMAKGDSQSKAIAAAQDAFINYDVPTGKGLDYMNKMGLFMFTKFIIRFQQAIARQLNTRAGSAVAQHFAVEELTNQSGVLEPFILNRLGNPFQAGLFNYGDAFDNITTVHFVKSMF